MRIRHQLPVWSPVTAAAIGNGLWAALRSNGAHAALETALRHELGCDDLLLVDSGTSALRLGLAAALAELPGTAPVALPSWGCYDLATAACGANAGVVFYDLAPETLAPEPASFSRMLSASPAAVVLVHWYGIPVDVRALAPAVESAGGVVIEDAAQGFGGFLRGRPLGALGSLAILSFGRGKGRTGGGGGALVSNDSRGAALIALARRAVNATTTGRTRTGILGAAGRSVAQWLLARPSWYGIPASIPFLHLGETIFQKPWPPTLMSAFSAAVLESTRAATAREAEVRRELGGEWLRRIEGNTLLAPVRPGPESESGWLRFPVLAAPAAVPRIEAGPARALGIIKGYPGPLSVLPELRSRVSKTPSLPGAERLVKSLYTVPTHSRLTESDRARITALLMDPSRD